jgi:hypothetical protein
LSLADDMSFFLEMVEADDEIKKIKDSRVSRSFMGQVL